ncbi:UNVERIFIED_CONTAM: hypothetical protein NCL1_20074 [Trichonephila clavipes]
MIVIHVFLLAGKSSLVFKYNENTSSFICRKKDSGFHYPNESAVVGRYLSHCSCKGKYLPCEFSFLFQ